MVWSLTDHFNLALSQEVFQKYSLLSNNNNVIYYFI